MLISRSLADEPIWPSSLCSTTTTTKPATSLFLSQNSPSHPTRSLYPMSSQQHPQIAVSQQHPGITRSRARADTLPTRLPPGLVPTSLYQTRVSQLSGLTQQNASSSSLPLNSITAANNNSLLSNNSMNNTNPNTNNTLLNNNNNTTNSSLLTSNPETSSSTSSLTVPSSRIRSGSLTLPEAPRVPLYSSLVSTNSIWAQRSPYIASTDSNRASQSSLFNLDDSSEQSNQPTRQPSPRLVDQSQSQNADIDPLGPFYKDLALRTDPSRMRSYTVNTLPYGLSPFDLQDVSKSQPQPQPQLQPQPSQPQPIQQSGLTRHLSLLSGNRPRAQTSATAFDPSLNSHLRMPQSHLYSHESQPLPEIIDSFDDNSIIPTRSLWIGNIPASTTSYALQAIFSSYGTVESARVLPHKNCGFVNFVSLDSAIQAKDVLNEKELFSGSGPCRVGFAKVVELNSFDDVAEFPQPVSLSLTPPPSQSSQQPQQQQQQSSQHQQQSQSQQDQKHLQKDNGNSSFDYSEESQDTFQPKTLEEIASDLVSTVVDLGSTPQEQAEIRSSVNRALEFDNFNVEIGSVPELRLDRVYDAPTLREVRKKIDSGSCTPEQIEDIALDILDEIAELSSDYVGNTVVQKLFDTCSEPVKDMMLQKIAPHLAQISIHKNGTWAAQKIIAVAGTKRQINMITEALRPFTVHLFLDQFGNYAIQCVLKFGAPWNDFIFETILSKFWDIAQGRFGARAMRACLESHYVSKQQQSMIAAAITMHAVQLATNANGALLLTWFLDTYTVPNRHTILAPKLIPHLVQLGTHRLASLTVLKVVNHRAEPGARQAIFNTLFNPSEEHPSTALEQILNHSYGPVFIFKILSTPFLEGQERHNAINKIRTVLVTIKAQPNQGYKRLMDEVGLSTRTNPNPNHNANMGNGNLNRNTNGNRVYPNQAPHPQNQFGMFVNHHQQQQRGRSVNGTIPNQFYPQQQQPQQSMMGVPPQMMMQQAQQQLNNQQNVYGNGGPSMNDSPTHNHGVIKHAASSEMLYSRGSSSPQQQQQQQQLPPQSMQFNQFGGGMGPQSMGSPMGMIGMPGMVPMNGGAGGMGGGYDVNAMTRQFDKMGMVQNGSMGGLPQQQQQYPTQMMGQNFYGGNGQQQGVSGNGYMYDM